MFETHKKQAINRLNKARGQLDGIIKMIENDKKPRDIVTQILALKGSLNGVNDIMLECHLYDRAPESLTDSSQRQKEKFIKEIIKTWSIAK
ncbi:hypothetical protein A2483_02495 [Candidatus Peregrinibacteria bacterium RIFOXYC2_FULL_33_13]|nr:MAG: hypothetical protein UR27_C0021G0006 [Candidatus Peregrinibacteria bacterium GW2011_GWA2_33_10]KKP41010.1 MAG: hypothetical protein UR30_C0002G0044 [Candidatus Peregrinibacteria bacterium GW2011_GWC2_33_13]OGJ55340.1 MAG: hypothetical protein A2483_02495 [Candidatus Peregrinibacteria bacterium RIFOXYC2_FULL_33_13]